MARQRAGAFSLAFLFAWWLALPGLAQIDRQATWETKVLYYNLDLLSEDFLLFGHQNTNVQGRGWVDSTGALDTSDVKAGVGSFPAVYGFDFGAGWDTYRAHVEKTFSRGGVITYSWHAPNPVTGGSFYDTRGNPIREIVPGGSVNDLYRSWLRGIAAYAKSLKVNGVLVPILFRPFHENTGHWFWWGANYCTPEEFIRAWRYTVHFLRDTLGVHNFLYVYSPDIRSAILNYEERYPGDDYVDVIGFDLYEQDDYSDLLVEACRAVVRFAEERGKIAAITETGVSGGLASTSVEDWFTRAFLDPLKADPVARRISWALFWTNSARYYWIPLPGDPQFPAFQRFYEDPFTVFEDDLPDMYTPIVEDGTAPVFTRYPERDFVSFGSVVTIEVWTDERAYLRYSTVDQPFGEMSNEFPEGQGGVRHRVRIAAEHGSSYTYYVRAADAFGNATDTSLVISFRVDTTLVAVTWKEPGYDDSEWPVGRAPLGYGRDAGNATELDSAKTVYFRARFTLPEEVTGLGVLVRGHDGTVVYVNGVEVGRIQIPPGAEVGYETEATSDRPYSKVLVLGQEALSRLSAGENLLAVEVHSAQGPVRDVSFDARVFNNDGIYLDLGSEWRYFDGGREPPTQVAQKPSGVLRQPGSKSSGRAATVLRGFAVRPNPLNASSRFVVQLSARSDLRIEVFDVRGRRVWTWQGERVPPGIRTVRMRRASLPSGVYLARAVAGREVRTAKFVVVR